MRTLCVLLAFLASSSNLEIEAVYLPETSENFHPTTRRNFLKTNTLHKSLFKMLAPRRCCHCLSLSSCVDEFSHNFIIVFSRFNVCHLLCISAIKLSGNLIRI
jgi:hypothetical protein